MRRVQDPVVQRRRVSGRRALRRKAKEGMLLGRTERGTIALMGVGDREERVKSIQELLSNIHEQGRCVSR